MKKELLRIENGIKGTILKQLYFQVCCGEISNLIFDNVQEKQMFLDILSGNLKLDYGKVYFREESIPEERIAEHFRSNVAVISRESNLIATITIGENLFLARPRVKEKWVRSRKYQQDAEQIFQEFDIAISAETKAGELSILECVEIEIVKAYLLGKQIIFLTALTNLLKDTEKKKLWELMGKFTEKDMAFVVVEPLEDIDFQYTDAVTIIKKGKTYAVKDAKDCDYITLYAMIYKEEAESRPERARVFAKEEKEQSGIKFVNLTTDYLKKITFSVRKGEIVKLFCMDEASYDEITAVMQGQRSMIGGRFEHAAKTMKAPGCLQGLKDGIGIVEGNPVMSSLFAELTAMDNLCIPLSNKVDGMWAISKYRKSIRRLLKGILDDSIYDQRISELEAEDIQRIIYGRWLLYAPELAVCIQPFAEGHIKARETAREMIYQLESRNIPVLIITSNSSELHYCRGNTLYLKGGELISAEEAYRVLYIV